MTAAKLLMALLLLSYKTIAFRCTPYPLSSIMSKRSSSQPNNPYVKKAKTQKSLSGFFSSKKGSSDDTSTTATTTSSSSSSSPSGYQIFCDLDGVLVDFDAGIRKLFNGRSPDELNQGVMWGTISKSDRFYANLSWTADGKVLWNEIKNHSITPHILTGVPRHNKSRAEKFAWCKKELGVEVNHVDMAGKKSAHELVTGRRKKKDGVVNVITCWSRNKHCESRENHVLIDDRISLRDAWEGRGGIFIHHTNTERTLTLLREKGVLDSKDGGGNAKSEE